MAVLSMLVLGSGSCRHTFGVLSRPDQPMLQLANTEGGLLVGFFGGKPLISKGSSLGTARPPSVAGTGAACLAPQSFFREADASTPEIRAFLVNL